MSISTLQEKFFNKGCGATILGVAAIAMVASMFTRGGGSSREESRVGAADAVVTVGGVPVPASFFQAQASELTARMMQERATQAKVPLESLGEPDATTQAMATANAVGAGLQRAAVESILQKTPVTEEEVAAVGAAAIGQRLDAIKQQFVKTGQLKPNATDAELEKALKKELNGKTIAQLRADSSASLLKDFKDPSKKAALISQFSGPLLVQRLGMQQVGTDAALKDSYKTYVVRRIFLSDTSGSKETPAVRAARTEADLKAGKSFDSLMDAVSNDPAPTGKKPHEVTESVPAESLSARPELASLKGQTPKATTGVVDVPGGKAIYQLVSVQDALPADFEKNKAALRAAKVVQIGQSEAEKQIKAFVASDRVKWKSPGYQALGLVADAMPQGFAFNQSAIKKATDAALAALKAQDPSDRRLAAQALLLLTDPSKVLSGKGSETAVTRRTALEAAQANGIEDATLSLEMAGIYGEAKDGAKATTALLAASKANTNYEASGQRLFGDVASKAIQLQKQGVLNKDQLSEIQAQQAVYTASRSENAKAAAQAKDQAAREEAANQAEIARQKAEAEKNTPKTGAVGQKSASDVEKENAAEIARQKAEAARKPNAGTNGSILPTTAGGG